LGLPVTQPTSSSQLVDVLTAQGPFEVGVVAAFGMLLPASALHLPRTGMINVHFSLLPRWRGAAPVVAAISAGDEETGVTLMKMDEGLDTGPLIAAAPVVIEDDETGGVLAGRLALLGAKLLGAHLGDWLRGAIEAVAQDPSQATAAPSVKAPDRVIDRRMQPLQAARRVRALSPQPGAVLHLDGLPHQILAAEPVAVPIEPGEVRVSDGEVLVGLANGGLRLLMIQPPGRRPLAAASWLRGLRHPPTSAF
jgi:methionyl-tRNA formyltransferase